MPVSLRPAALEDPLNLPSVYAFLDYRAFLKHWFEAKKQAVPSYSYATFAAAGGGSKATLANVLSGARNPRPATLDHFAVAMELSPSERNYLGVLVTLSTAQDADTRRRIIQRILSTERFRQVRMAETEGEENAARYLQNWYTPAIREMATLDGFEADAEWVRDHLVPSITLAEAQASLDTLFDLGLFVRDAQGTVRVREPEYRSEAESTQYAVTRFHREQIPRLLQQIDTSKSDEQHLITATLSLPQSALPEIKQELNLMAQRIAALQHQASPDGKKRVYQLGIQLLPLSEPL